MADKQEKMIKEIFACEKDFYASSSYGKVVMFVGAWDLGWHSFALYPIPFIHMSVTSFHLDG